MGDDVLAIRERLRLAVQEAEKNEEYHRHLKSDLSSALARFDLQISHRQVGLGMDDDDPGCSDFTCFTSMCPETCYVTVCSPSVMEGDPAERVINPAAINKKFEGPRGGQ